jgi:hypothetical protein
VPVFLVAPVGPCCLYPFSRSLVNQLRSFDAGDVAMVSASTGTDERRPILSARDNTNSIRKLSCWHCRLLWCR